MQSSVHRDTTKTIQCLIDTQANKERHTNFPFEDDRHLFTTLNTKEPKRTTGLYRRIETDQSLRSHLELSQFCLLLLPEGSPTEWEVYAISCQDKHAIS